MRAEGVTYDREEHTPGICAIGAVVGEVLGETVAISVPMPAQRFYGLETELRAPARGARSHRSDLDGRAESR